MRKILPMPGRFKAKYTARGTVRITKRKWLILPLTILLLGGTLYIYTSHVKADSFTTAPVSDLQTGWATSTGTSHFALVDEGTSPSTTDYVHTGTGSTTSITDEYGLTTVPNVASASQLVLNVYAEAATVGSTADTLNINLKVSGTLQTQSTCTPGSGGAGVYAWCTATFTGSWTQTNVNAMSAVISNTVNGTGPGSGREDDIRVADIYGTLTYVSSMTETQASYRVFDNADAGSQTTFVKSWGGTGNETGASVVQTSDGGYAMTGQTFLTDTTNGDMYITKYTSSGTLSWSKTWGGSGSDISNSIIQTSDGGYALTGVTASYGAGGQDMFIVKYNSSGTLSWSKTWGGTGNDAGDSIIQTSDGGYAISGLTGSYGAGGNDVVIAKYTSTGTLSWSRTWGGSGSEWSIDIIQTSDGGYAAIGKTSTTSFSAGGSDMFIAKYNSSGSIAGCSSTVCKSDTVGGGTDYTSVNKSDTVGGGTDYTSTSTVDVSLSPSGIDVNPPIAAANTAAAITGDGTAFRIRMDVRLTGATLSANAGSFKLQYALRGVDNSCDTSFSGETYSDVTDTSTVRYYDNPNASNGIAVTANLNDPTDGANTPVYETYQEKGTTTFTNPTAIPGNQYGVWDFALNTSQTLPGQHYCMKIVKSSTNLDAYVTGAIAEISLPAAPTYSQAAYGWYTNANSTSVGAALAVNSSYSLPALNTPVRLRALIAVSNTGLTASGQSFKLQYATLTTSCAASSYSDVTSSTPIRWFDNSTPASGAAVTPSGSDPTDGSNTIVAETYQESNNFTNPTIIYAGQDGLWDFSLTDDGVSSSATYCFRVVNSAGTPLTTYTAYPTITTFSTGPTGPTTDQVMRGGQYFSSGVKQPLYWAQ
jgi:hypothetical protein